MQSSLDPSTHEFEKFRAGLILASNKFKHKKGNASSSFESNDKANILDTYFETDKFEMGMPIQRYKPTNKQEYNNVIDGHEPIRLNKPRFTSTRYDNRRVFPKKRVGGPSSLHERVSMVDRPMYTRTPFSSKKGTQTNKSSQLSNMGSYATSRFLHLKRPPENRPQTQYEINMHSRKFFDLGNSRQFDRQHKNNTVGPDCLTRTPMVAHSSEVKRVTDHNSYVTETPRGYLYNSHSTPKNLETVYSDQASRALENNSQYAQTVINPVSMRTRRFEKPESKNVFIEAQLRNNLSMQSHALTNQDSRAKIVERESSRIIDMKPNEYGQVRTIHKKCNEPTMTNVYKPVLARGTSNITRPIPTFSVEGNKTSNFKLEHAVGPQQIVNANRNMVYLTSEARNMTQVVPVPNEFIGRTPTKRYAHSHRSPNNQYD